MELNSSSSHSIKGKNAIITGARSGIGLATLRLFAQNGCNCWAIVHRDDPDFLGSISEWQSEYGVWIKPVHIDLENSEEIKYGLRTIIQEKLPIDILVNAAGIVSPSRLFTMTRMEDIRKVMEVNFFSAVQLTQIVCKSMMRNKKGSIVNIASISAWGEDTSQIEYAASKAAIIIFTKKLASEMGAYGIRVNAVAPGLTDTKILSHLKLEAIDKILEGMAIQRLGKPEEIAEACLWLASSASSFVTAQVLRVDGGVI